MIGLPSHTTDILQPLDVGVFQPLKHYHSQAVNNAVALGDETFTKVEFLNVFNIFKAQAFKPATIRSAWAKCGLIPYNPSRVIDAIREISTEHRPTIPPQQPWSFGEWDTQTTPHGLHMLTAHGCELKYASDIPSHLRTSIEKYVRGAISSARYAALVKEQLDRTQTAENTRKARKRERNRVL